MRRKPMKGLLARALKLLMGFLDRMSAESPSRKASKMISKVEKDGGYVLKCGCFVAARSVELRKMVMNCGPEAVIDVEAEVFRGHEPGPECRSGKPKKARKQGPV